LLAIRRIYAIAAAADLPHTQRTTFANAEAACVWQEHLVHFGGLIWPTLSH